MQLEARINGATEQKGEPLGCESRGERQLPFAVPLWMAPLPRSEGTFELRTSKDLDRICKRINQTHARGNAKNGFPRCCPAELNALRFSYDPAVRSCRRRRAERERDMSRKSDPAMPLCPRIMGQFHESTPFVYKHASCYVCVLTPHNSFRGFEECVGDVLRL